MCESRRVPARVRTAWLLGESELYRTAVAIRRSRKTGSPATFWHAPAKTVRGIRGLTVGPDFSSGFEAAGRELPLLHWPESLRRSEERIQLSPSARLAAKSAFFDTRRACGRYSTSSLRSKIDFRWSISMLYRTLKDLGRACSFGATNRPLSPGLL